MNLTIGSVRWMRLVTISALAFTAILSSFAATAIGSDSPFPQFDSANNQQSVLDYWTPARMESAQPIGPPGTANRARTAFSTTMGSTTSSPLHQTSILGSQEVALHPHTSIGKVFLTLNGTDHVCSACAVTSEGRWGEGSGQLVLTAGHCLNNGFGGFASNFVFAPGYSDGVAPLGRWTAERLFTTNQWHSGFGAALGRDVGFALVRGAGDYAGQYLHDVVEPLDIAFTQSYPEDGIDFHVEPAIGVPVASFGYGVLNWGGESQVRSVAQTNAIDANFSPPPIGLPSTHTGGSSGGPWLYNYAPDSYDEGQNIVAGVNSYVYGGIDQMYSPQFDDLIHQLWSYVETSSAPVPQVPEPSSLVLLGLAGVAIAARRRPFARPTGDHSEESSRRLPVTNADARWTLFIPRCGRLCE